MSGIKAPILDVLTRLAAIQVVNAELQTVGLFTRIWNNQIARQDDGSGYAFPRPAAFVEVINAVSFDIIGLGVRSADLGFRIHLVHDYYNGSGTMEQDLVIFDLRDQILSTVTGLSQFVPTACGAMNCVREEQEYDHDNTYHYVMDFVCKFFDSKGSPFDEGQGIVYEVTPDLDLVEEVTYNIPQ
jgi:hypothetical protein